MSRLTALEVAMLIDHTKLAFVPGEDAEQAIRQLCQEASTYGFYAVCVRPEYIHLAKACLVQTSVKVATVIGFPQQPAPLETETQDPTIGDVPLETKLLEAQTAFDHGADELDLVLNIPQFKAEFQAQAYPHTLAELQAIREATLGRPVKVILETDLLSPLEIVAATRCCAQATVAMVKTSTGFIQGGVGATVENIRLIHNTLQALNAPLGIKASGGVRTGEIALAMIQAGATRIGTSSGVSIVQALAADLKEPFAEPTALG